MKLYANLGRAAGLARRWWMGSPWSGIRRT